MNFGFYVNVEGILQIVGKMAPPPAVQMAEKLGVTDIKVLSGSLNTAGKELNTTFYMYAPKSDRGIHKLYKFKPVNFQKTASHIPHMASVFSTGTVNLNKLMGDVEDIIKSIDPSGAMGLFINYKQGLEFIEGKLGLSFKNDLFAAFESTSCSASFYLPAGGLFPENISVGKMKDVKKVKKCIKVMSKLLGVSVKTYRYKKYTIHYFTSKLGRLGTNPFRKLNRMRNPLDAFKMSFANAFSGMAYTMDGDYFYFSQSSQGLMAYLDWKHSYKPALSGNKSFIKAVEKTDPKSFGFLYLDPSLGMRKWYNTFRFLVRMFEGYIRAAGIPLETALLPRSCVLARYFGKSTWTLTADEGLVIKSRGGLSVMLTGVAAVGIGAAIAIPAIISAKEKAQEAAHKATLRSFYSALNLYRTSHGKYPKTKYSKYSAGFLNELAKKKYLYARNLYQYRCTSLPLGYWCQKSSAFPIIWTRYPRRGYHIVLFFDGHVEKVHYYRLSSLNKDRRYEYSKSIIKRKGSKKEGKRIYKKGFYPETKKEEKKEEKKGIKKG